MIIGVPKEIKSNENRVALTPSGAAALRRAGHTVLVESKAGSGSGFFNGDYEAGGATVLDEAVDIFQRADLIIKVKEPQIQEYSLLRPGQILFTYLHLAPEPVLTEALLEKKVTAIAYETIRNGNTLPLLTPMSEVAGRMAVQVGVQYLTKPFGGKGILAGGVPGVEPAQVIIVGGGTVGLNAARMAVGLGARVVVLDASAQRLQQLDDLFSGRITTIMSNMYTLSKWTARADLLIGAVLLPGAAAPKLITKPMVMGMSPGSVIVDVAIDQGGCVETIDHATTHDNPVYEKYGILHYAVANMPGAVPRTSTIALTNATLPYALQLASLGWKEACRRDDGLAAGLNTVNGYTTCQAVAETHKLTYYHWQELLSQAKEQPEN